MHHQTFLWNDFALISAGLGCVLGSGVSIIAVKALALLHSPALAFWVIAGSVAAYLLNVALCHCVLQRYPFGNGGAMVSLHRVAFGRCAPVIRMLQMSTFLLGMAALAVATAKLVLPHEAATSDATCGVCAAGLLATAAVLKTWSPR